MLKIMLHVVGWRVIKPTKMVLGTYVGDDGSTI